MKQITALLDAHKGVSSYKINRNSKESYELFFVKGRLETVRSTDTCDTTVTVYADHGEYKGHAQFVVYPSTTEEELAKKIDEAASKALLINNAMYHLPGKEQGEYEVESNFSAYSPAELAALVANAVFEGNTMADGSLNSVEIFINKHTETVCNSCGLHKTQIRYDAMVEAIPTYNGSKESVELYEDYKFSSFDAEAVRNEIAEKMAEVKARYNAAVPQESLNCGVVLNKLELMQLFWSIAEQLDYASVYSRHSVFHKGDRIQKAPEADRIGITMQGCVPGCIRSSMFDSDGLMLGSIRLVEDGKAVNYYGSNRFGQYLGEQPTGMLRCLRVDNGSLTDEQLKKDSYLEIISMSGLQVDFYSDYIGGEIRLAYYHEGDRITPLTGVSISGALSEVLNCIQLSEKSAICGRYIGPDKALISGMRIF